MRARSHERQKRSMWSHPLTFQTLKAPDVSADVESGIDATSSGRWTRGLCECFSNFGMCCCVMWCQPCATGQVQSIVRGGAAAICMMVTFGIVILNMIGSSMTALPELQIGGSVIMSFAGFLSFLAVCNARAAYRKRDAIPPDCGSGPLGDCLAACFCSPCSLCQMFSQDGTVACADGERGYKGFWSTYGRMD